MNEDWKLVFKDIKKAYAVMLPLFMHEYRVSGDTRVDPYFFDWDLTPIEASVWQDLRSRGMPFLPQFPACGYFLDFADPFKRIAVECDGKDFHNAERDAKRDDVLEANGWLVFRIPGRQCNKIMRPHPFEREHQERDIGEIREWLIDSSEGFAYALEQVYYRDDDTWKDKEWANYIRQTLSDHCSTTDFLDYDEVAMIDYIVKAQSL